MLSENGDVIKSPLDREYQKWRTDATIWLQFRANFANRYIAHESSSFEHAY